MAEDLQITLDPEAFRPRRAHEDDAGLDLISPRNITVGQWCWEDIDTGVHVSIPKGYVGLITAKSGLMAKRAIFTSSTIDAGYTGSLHVVLFNHSSSTYVIRKGQKIAQLVILPIITPKVVIVDKLPDTERGDGGFGSTGAMAKEVTECE